MEKVRLISLPLLWEMFEGHVFFSFWIWFMCEMFLLKTTVEQKEKRSAFHKLKTVYLNNIFQNTASEMLPVLKTNSKIKEYPTKY